MEEEEVVKDEEEIAVDRKKKEILGRKGINVVNSFFKKKGNICKILLQYTY